MTLLQVRALEAGYGVGPPILRGIDLDVEEGGSYCVIGPNGAGKSTLLRAIVGVLRPRAGTVLFRGGDLAGLRPDQVLERGVCFVPQDRSLFPEMTVRENLVMGGFLVRNREVIADRIHQVFELFPILEDKSGQLAGNLSGGQQQMLALGRSLMVEPTLLCVDEPSLGLAPDIVEQVFSVLSQFRERGITIFLVEQNAVRGLEWADWGFVLDLGTLRLEGPADEILANPQVRELYLGKTMVQSSGEAE